MEFTLMFIERNLSPKSNLMLEFLNVTKIYRRNKWKGFRFVREKIKAVADLTFEIRKGESVGIIGPNGAGKSTILKLATGVLYPDSGEIKLFGKNPFTERRRLSKIYGVFWGHRSLLWPYVPVKMSYRVIGEMYEIDPEILSERINSLAEKLNVSHLLSVDPLKMSLGQRIKVNLMASMLHNPRILFLDEPTIGLDVASRLEIRNFLISLKGSTTIVYSSNELFEIERVCDRVIILDSGKKIFDGELEKLKTIVSDEVELSFYSDNPIEGLIQEPGYMKIRLKRENLNSFLYSLLQYGVRNLSIKEPSIEELVLKIHEKH